MSSGDLRQLDITDLERIERFRRAGYGGSVSDALYELGIVNTVFSQRFRPLKPEMILTGRALPIKLHSLPIDARNMAEQLVFEKRKEAEPGGHPQKRMMKAVAESEDGVVLCFDCGGDLQAAHFGEMSCQLSYAQGCRGMLIAGNCRDTRYVMQMPDFPLFSFGMTPNAFGGWMITEVNVPVFMPGHCTHYVRVNPGDWIFGDSDGAQLIPRDYVDEVLLRVETTFEKENKEREILRAGLSVDEVYRRFGAL